MEVVLEKMCVLCCSFFTCIFCNNPVRLSFISLASGFIGKWVSPSGMINSFSNYALGRLMNVTITVLEICSIIWERRLELLFCQISAFFSCYFPFLSHATGLLSVSLFFQNAKSQFKDSSSFQLLPFLSSSILVVDSLSLPPPLENEMSVWSCMLQPGQELKFLSKPSVISLAPWLLNVTQTI